MAVILQIIAELLFWEQWGHVYWHKNIKILASHSKLHTILTEIEAISVVWNNLNWCWLWCLYEYYIGCNIDCRISVLVGYQILYHEKYADADEHHIPNYTQASKTLLLWGQFFLLEWLCYKSPRVNKLMLIVVLHRILHRLQEICWYIKFCTVDNMIVCWQDFLVDPLASPSIVLQWL